MEIQYSDLFFPQHLRFESGWDWLIHPFTLHYRAYVWAVGHYDSIAIKPNHITVFVHYWWAWCSSGEVQSHGPNFSFRCFEHPWFRLDVLNVLARFHHNHLHLILPVPLVLQFPGSSVTKSILLDTAPVWVQTALSAHQSGSFCCMPKGVENTFNHHARSRLITAEQPTSHDPVDAGGRVPLFVLLWWGSVPQHASSLCVLESYPKSNYWGQDCPGGVRTNRETDHSEHPYLPRCSWIIHELEVSIIIKPHINSFARACNFCITFPGNVRRSLNPHICWFPRNHESSKHEPRDSHWNGHGVNVKLCQPSDDGKH